MGRVELPQRGGELVSEIARQIGIHGNGQLAAHDGRHEIRPLPEITQLLEEVLSKRVNFFAMSGEREPSATAPAQCDSEPRFQAGDIDADGGLALVEQYLGPRKTSPANHCIEYAQQAQVVICEFWEWFARFHHGALSRPA